MKLTLAAACLLLVASSVRTTEGSVIDSVASSVVETKCGQEYLYVTDLGGSGSVATVQVIDVSTGEYIGKAVDDSVGLQVPNTVNFFNGKMIVTDATTGNTAGRVLSFDVPQSAYSGTLTASDLPFKHSKDVLSATATVPAAYPDGIAIDPLGKSIFISDNGIAGTNFPGQVIRLDAKTYEFQGILDTTGMPHPFDQKYYPNTGAFGPDGLLYVAQAAAGTDDSFGAIVVFDVTTSSPGKFVKTFTDNTASGCGGLLHRPDYPLWGKDGRLYINGFKAVRNSPNTSDVVLAYGADGTCQNTVISFDTPAESAKGFRDFGTATVGPGLDIPIYTAMFDGSSSQTFVNGQPVTSPAKGSIRKYHAKADVGLASIENSPFTTVFPAGKQLVSPQASSFIQTDPSSKNYVCPLTGNIPTLSGLLG